MTYDPTLMQRAIALSAQALTTPGTEPFGALVVCDGVVVGEGFKATLNKSQHARRVFAG